ncbi:MAG: hypothetical protein WAO76_13330 [Georgfuchsia sp.]
MYKLTGVVLTSALVMAGCGSGGGGSSSSTAAALPTTTSLSGTAAKGMIKQARVLACRIADGAPEPDASCASGTTGNDGSFKVTFSDGYTGPTMVKVMASAASTMMDETTGNDIPYNMTMRAVVPSISGTTTVYVTPFSEMAASAVSTTMIDATKIHQSISTVESLMSSMGINLSVMPMVNLKDNGTNSNMLAMQSNMVKQLARVALAAKNSNMLMDANGVPCNAVGTTPSQQIACTVEAMASVMTSYGSYDMTKAATMMTALNGQNVTNITMPVITAEGTISSQVVDMTSSASMQTAMLNAGMSVNNAAYTVNVIMGGMH